MFRATMLIGLVAAAFCSSGCGGDGTKGAPDGGAAADSSVAVDLDAVADTSTGTDTAAMADTMAGADGDAVPDAAPDADAAVEVDSGPVTTCAAGGGSTSCNDDWASSCGGNPIGTWTLVSTCAHSDLGVLGICYPGTITDNSTASGSLSFDGTTLTRDVTLDIALDVHVPPTCTGNGSAACADLAVGMTQNVAVGTVTCSDDGSNGCDCVHSASLGDQSTADYVVDGDEIVVDQGTVSERRWAFCVADGVLTLREVGEGVDEQDIVQVYSCAD